MVELLLLFKGMISCSLFFIYNSNFLFFLFPSILWFCHIISNGLEVCTYYIFFSYLKYYKIWELGSLPQWWYDLYELWYTSGDWTTTTKKCGKCLTFFVVLLVFFFSLFISFLKCSKHTLFTSLRNKLKTTFNL